MTERIMFLDLEVENNPYFGALASPHNPANYIVAVGYALDTDPYDGAVEGSYFHSKEEAKDWLTIPDDVWLLVCHNASFEVSWLLAERYDEFMKFLGRGGRVYCTQLGHYLLSRQQELYPALDDIAPQYGGSHKIDEVVLHWQQGKLTSEIDRDLLLEYLLGEQGDIVNTRLCFYGQYTSLVARGMWEMALARSDALLFNAFAMYSGLKVDRELALNQLKEQEDILHGIEAMFAEVRDGYFNPEVEFKPSSRFHWSAWLFGGPIKYRTRVPRETADGKPVYVKGEAVSFLATDMVAFVGVDIEADEVHNDDEWYVETFGDLPVRYKSGKNKGLVKITKEDTEELDTKWGDVTWDCPPIVDLSKLPTVFTEEFLKEYTGKQTLADGSPVISTSEDAVKALLTQNIDAKAKEILGGLLKWVTLNKDIGAFYLRQEYDDEGNVIKQSGALQYLTDQDYIYHTLNATSTVTGRLSGSRPNMQQLPKKSDVKRMYVSRFGEHGSIIEADYKALEVVALADFSGDENLQEALRQGKDMHLVRVAAKTGRDYDELVAIYADEEHPEYEWVANERDKIKAPSFAYQYGATARGIAYATGYAVDDAQAFIDREKELFPDVERFADTVAGEVSDNSTTFREMADDGSFRIFRKGYWKSPSGMEYEFREYPFAYWLDGERHEGMDYKPTQMRNYPIQGESSFFVQCACSWVLRWLIEENFYDGRVVIVNTVHDAIYLDVHNDVLKEVAPILREIMESVPEGMSELGYNLTMPYPVDVTAGPNMAEQHKISEE